MVVAVCEKEREKERKEITLFDLVIAGWLVGW